MGGVHSARPKAVWERLQPDFPKLTVQVCSQMGGVWHGTHFAP
jgi:hypothetical protein